MSKKWNYKNIISAIVTLIIAFVIYLSIPAQVKLPKFAYEVAGSFNARTVPYFLTIIIIILSIIDIILSIRTNILKTDTDMEQKEENKVKSPNYFGLLIAFVSILLWIIFTIYFGFRLATIFLVVAIMLVIGNRKWWQIVLLSLILSIPMDYLLKAVLRVYLPEGIFFE